MNKHLWIESLALAQFVTTEWKKLNHYQKKDSNEHLFFLQCPEDHSIHVIVNMSTINHSSVLFGKFNDLGPLFIKGVDFSKHNDDFKRFIAF